MAYWKLVIVFTMLIMGYKMDVNRKFQKVILNILVIREHVLLLVREYCQDPKLCSENESLNIDNSMNISRK